MSDINYNLFSDLLTGDSFWSSNISEWLELEAAFDGGYKYISDVIKKNPLESDKNFKNRLSEAYYFNLPATIIGLYAFSIMEQEPKSEYGSLAEDECWKKFTANCDTFGSDMKDFIDNTQINASVCGSCGILINKPPVPESIKTKQQELDNGIIPYLTTYSPKQILEAKFQRNFTTHKIELVKLRLHDFDDRVQVWTKSSITIFEKATEHQELEKRNHSRIVFDGPNPLGEIPFVFLINLKQNSKSLRNGLSDIREIHRISASIMRNCSIAEEIFNNAGFPMMRKPLLEEGESDPDESGPTAILEFNPEYGDGGKPDWLKPEVRESVVSLIEWIEKKTDEIYRIAYLSGLHQQAKGSQVRSGVAMRYELQQLTSILTQKIKGLKELESEIIRLFLKWQNMEEKFKEVNITRPIEFTMDELVSSIDMLKESLKVVSSDKFNVAAQKRIVQLLMPGLPKNLLDDIYGEIKSTRDIYLAQDLAGTNDKKFGTIHTKARNSERLAKINAEAMASTSASPENQLKGNNMNNTKKEFDSKTNT